MKTRNFFIKKLAICGMSAALMFSLAACGDSREVAEEDGLVEDGAITEIDNDVAEDTPEYTEVSDRGFYDDWDRDRSGVVNEEEFRENWASTLGETDYDANAFNEWDINKDANLDENEFRTGVWTRYNKDGDASMNQDEFAVYTREVTVNRWDTDDVDGISETEFREGWGGIMGDRPFNETQFGEWDLNDDNLLDDNELNTGLFTLWDVDGNGTIEVVEYERIR